MLVTLMMTPPALASSLRPARASMRRKHSSTATASATSQASASTPAGAVPLRLIPNTLAPAPPMPAASAAPMPREAPVTAATRPCKPNAPGASLDPNSGIAIAAHDDGAQFDVFGFVDLHELVTFHDVQADRAAEAIVPLPQQPGFEHVERAILEEAALDRLTHAAAPIVVVYRL